MTEIISNLPISSCNQSLLLAECTSSFEVRNLHQTSCFARCSRASAAPKERVFPEGWQRCRRYAPFSAGGGLLRLLRPTRCGAAVRGARFTALCFYFLDFLQPSTVGWLVGRSAVCSNEKVSSEGRWTLVGAVGWAGRRGRYRFHPAWRGERPPSLLQLPLSFPRPLPSSSPPCNPRTPGHRVKAHGRRLTVASSKWVSRGWCASVRTCFSNTCAHVRVLRRFALLLPRCHGINPSSLLVACYAVT